MSSESFDPMCLSHPVEHVGAKESANSTDQEYALNVKLILGTWWSAIQSIAGGISRTSTDRLHRKKGTL